MTFLHFGLWFSAWTVIWSVGRLGLIKMLNGWFRE